MLHVQHDYFSQFLTNVITVLWRLWIFSNPELYSSTRIRRIRWRIRDPELFEYALQSGYFWIRYESGTAESGKFLFPDDVTRSRTVLYCEINSQDDCQGQYCFYIAHALLRVRLFPWGVLSTRVNPDAFGLIRYVWMRIFLKNIRPDTCGWSLNLSFFKADDGNDT